MEQLRTLEPCTIDGVMMRIRERQSEKEMEIKLAMILERMNDDIQIPWKGLNRRKRRKSTIWVVEGRISGEILPLRNPLD